MTSKNYNYGLRSPVENRDRVLDQLRLASAYRNKLVEIELARRAATDETLRELCPGLLECEAELASISTAIDDVLAQQRGRNQRARGMTDESDFRARLAELKPRRKELAARRKTLRAGSFAAVATQERLAAVNETAAEAIRAARASCGVFWGSYLLVEQAADAFRKGAPPVFRGFRGEGRIAVQIQGGMTWDEASSGEDTRLRIVHTPQTEARTARNGTVLPLPGAKQQAKLYTLRLRIGSNGRAPIWATWPLILHRPIPDGARIMWAVVRREIVAGQERWQLTLSLRDDTDQAFVRRDVATTGVCGVDIGYRYIDDRAQRVACWHGSDGASGELKLPAGKVAEWKKVDDMQSIRDDLHNVARVALRDWLAANPHPEWLDEATDHMHAWRRLSRLDRLVVQWRGQRFDGDEAIMESLEAWRTRERHLWQYQEHLRDQLLAWRKDFYRNFAAMLRRRYRTIAIEDMDLRSAIHDVLRPEEERETVTAQRRAARFAALSTLVGALNDSEADVIRIERAGTTSTCSWCGATNDVGAEVRHTCVGCGREWDRDANAARNILARGEAAVKTRESLAGHVGQGVVNGNGDGKKPTRSQRLGAARKKRSGVKPGKELG
jgi:hypothetical protein